MRRKGKDLFKGLMKLVSKRQNYDNEEATPTTAAEVDLSNYDLFYINFPEAGSEFYCLSVLWQRVQESGYQGKAHKGDLKL